jgi:hypothetical protein
MARAEALLDRVLLIPFPRTVPDRHPNGVRLPLPGHVIATSTAGKRFTVSTGKSGRFTMFLAPGTYRLTGYSPRVHVNGQEMRCVAAHPVRSRLASQCEASKSSARYPDAVPAAYPIGVVHRAHSPSLTSNQPPFATWTAARHSDPEGVLIRKRSAHQPEASRLRALVLWW